MNTTKRIILGLVGIATITLTASAATAAPNSGTFRTSGYFIGLTQGTNTITGKPAYADASFSGHNLVNVALGRSLNDTNYPNQVLALSFAPDLSSADLVVYDSSISNIVATIAQSTSVDSVKQQDKKQVGPNRAQFVATLLINPTGNNWNSLQGGYFTVAGRVNLDPATGAPGTVAVSLDTDSLDGAVGNFDVPAALDPGAGRGNTRTGLAHLIGDLDEIINGQTETILVPDGILTIGQPLPLVPVYTGAS
jgi:hypothetical protein